MKKKYPKKEKRKPIRKGIVYFIVMPILGLLISSFIYIFVFIIYPDYIKEPYTPPTIELQIYEGPIYSDINRICYYRIEAKVTGNPIPTVNFSKDDSSGALGTTKCQVDLHDPTETYILTANATNSKGSATNSISLIWGCGDTLRETKVIVSASGTWVDTGLIINENDQINITSFGTWNPISFEPSKECGPDGCLEWHQDNFFNLEDIGVGQFSATTKAPHWGALIGYIGDDPPPTGSYTSATILEDAKKIFFIGSNFNVTATEKGRLWLNFNDDAYSNNTSDNSGKIEATIKISN